MFRNESKERLFPPNAGISISMSMLSNTVKLKPSSKFVNQHLPSDISGHNTIL